MRFQDVEIGKDYKLVYGRNGFFKFMEARDILCFRVRVLEVPVPYLIKKGAKEETKPGVLVRLMGRATLEGKTLNTCGFAGVKERLYIQDDEFIVPARLLIGEWEN